MAKAVLGIVGGSGVYDLPGLEDVREERIDSPWGEPSDVLRVGHIGGTEIAFLPRHGRGHRLSPSDINYRANIDVMKRAGVTDLIWGVPDAEEDVVLGSLDRMAGRLGLTPAS